MTICSFLVSFGRKRKLVRPEHAHMKTRTVTLGTLEQAVIRRHEPLRARFFCKRQVQCIERGESQSGENTGAFGSLMAAGDVKRRRFQPKKGCEATVFTGVSFVLHVMCGRMHKPDSTVAGGVEGSGHGFGLAPDSFHRRIIERPLEATDVEVNDVAHWTMVPLRTNLRSNGPAVVLCLKPNRSVNESQDVIRYS